MKSKPKKEEVLDPRAMRMKLGLNQLTFWSRLGVTQSGGSRYESGRNMSKPVQTLLIITHGTDAQAAAAVAQLRRTK